SYNCGRGGVRRAIQRSGLQNPDFWQLAGFLPRETQDYVPKFIAMAYTLQHAEAYGISAAPTDFLCVPNAIIIETADTLSEIALGVDLALETIEKFNPAYKRSVINASVESPKRLVVPETAFLNDSLLYLALNGQLVRSKEMLAALDEGSSVTKASSGKGDRL